MVEDDAGREQTRARLVTCSRPTAHLVEALRDALLERHELIGHEITDVLEAARPEPARAWSMLAQAARARRAGVDLAPPGPDRVGKPGVQPPA